MFLRHTPILLFACLALCCLTAPTQASNLNSQSNLIDEGIEPAPVEVRTILGDIPLMEGLHPYHDPQLVHLFSDDPNDPVVTVGIVDADDVYNFYKRTLPKQGWQATSGRDYSQASKSLHIDAHAEGKMTMVIFTVMQNLVNK